MVKTSWTRFALAVALAAFVCTVASLRPAHDLSGAGVANISSCHSEHSAGHEQAPGGREHDCPSCLPCCDGVVALKACFGAAPTPTRFARSEPRKLDLIAPAHAHERATLARGPPSLS
jgi:hypothetical protein